MQAVKYLIISAVPFEQNKLTSKIKINTEIESFGVLIKIGTINKTRVALVIGGVGKVNTAHAVTLALSLTKPEMIVMVGCAGAYIQSGAEIGDVVLVEKEIYGDEGAITQNGWMSIEEMNLPTVKKRNKIYYHTFPLDETLVASLVAEIQSKYLKRKREMNFKLLRGIAITVSVCSKSNKRAKEMESLYPKAICESMEGAAAAQVAFLHNIPFFEIRGISNIVGDRDFQNWNIPLSVNNAQDILLLIL
ncbi:MAG: futalosine hydrolase [Methanosarcinales archaeon]